MTMMEMFEMGYEVTVGSPYGDAVMETVEEVQFAMEDTPELVEVDHEAKTAYFYDDPFESDDWGEDL